VEELVARCKALADQLVEQEALLRQQFEEKIQTIEDDKVLQSLMCDHHQKEAVVLKEEVRRLQVEKYETEKLNRELAHKLEQQAHSKRVFISQLSEIEQKYRSIEENFSEIIACSPFLY
jgi:ABC-type nitrate/sulfonate/bicarbonate transport system ATPase subunit